MADFVNKFTVDRAYWGHGNNGQEGYLRKRNGCMCVLGFYGKACGLTYSALTNRVWLPGAWYETPQQIRGAHSTITSLNDRKENKHGAAYKEARLINAFKRLGIRLRFVGKAKKLAK